MTDIVIAAPTAKATFPAEISPQDMVALQAARIRELESEVAAKTMAASTIANIACCLVRVHGERDRVVVPRELSDRLRGVQLTVAETGDGDLAVYVRDREVPAPIGREDRGA